MDPRKLKVNELKEQLQLAGLSVNGKKEELVARLLEHQKAEEEAALAAGPPTGTGESFSWEDPIDDLAPPAADASTKSTPAAAITPAAKAPATKATTTTTATAATPATNAAKPESVTTENSVQFQGATASDNDALKAEIEKRKSRAARFGTALTEQDKALERAARFGVPVAATTTASLAKAAGAAVAPATTATKAATTGAAKSGAPSKPSSIASQTPADVLSKRQARFGIVEPAAKASSTPAKAVGTTIPAAAAASGIKKSGLVLDAAEEEKKRKRAAKFGLPSAEDDASKKAKV